MIGMIHFTCFIFTVLSSSFSLAAFNCHGLKSSISYVLDLSNGHDIVFGLESVRLILFAIYWRKMINLATFNPVLTL